MPKIPVSSHDHIQGDANAPVVLVEYGDYDAASLGPTQSSSACKSIS